MDTWTGAEARLLRTVALRLSVREFAGHLGIPPRTVSKWEQAGAARSPRPHMQAILDTALHRADKEARRRFEQAVARHKLDTSPVVDLVAAGNAPLIIDEEEDVDRREFTKTLLGIGALTLSGVAGSAIAAATTSTRIDGAFAQSLRSAADLIRKRDQNVGGGVLLNQAGECLTRAKSVLETATYSADVGTELLSATGDLALAAGWVAYDADRQDVARQWYSDALALATEAGDDDLAVHALQNSALLAMSSNGASSPSRAMQLSERSRIIARNIRSGRLHALIAMRTAVAHAAVGDRSGFERAIASAWRELEHAEPDSTSAPRWLRFVVPAEVRYHEARGRAFLGDLNTAATAYQTGAEEQVNPRNTANYRAAFASTLAGMGDVTTSIVEGVTVLDSLEGNVSSWRSLRQLEPVRSAATNSSEGEEFRTRFDKLITRTRGAA